ncbi:NADAR family protein [Pseudonocardiaceae bacterium YIM PH 21723]|nr:NADAR family protein [Pseudonocardiaceae bacterium YIM PH 21723]
MRTDLIAAIEQGQRFDYLPFYGHQPENPAGPLSQWWPAAFTVDGRTYATAEHWMMAEKARLFDDRDTVARILDDDDPAVAKQLGRQVAGFDSAQWAAARFDVVVAGSRHKFGSSPRLREFLLGTGDRVLVEAAPGDPIWGIGLGVDDPRVSDPRQWRGENLLGFALMAARRDLGRSG